MGWVLDAPVGLGYMKKRIHDFSGLASGTIYQGTAQYFDVTINQDFTLFAALTVQPATSGIIRMYNSDSVAHNVYIGASTYSVSGFSSRLFMCVGDSYTSTEVVVPLNP